VTTPNLPAAQPVPPFVGDANIPLNRTPAVALAFALGYAAARPQNANQFGPFCALLEELALRPCDDGDGLNQTTPIGLGSWDTGTALGALMAAIPGRLASQISLLYQGQRGQRWARTGRRHGSGGATISG
jgi:hypothetical protein